MRWIFDLDDTIYYPVSQVRENVLKLMKEKLLAEISLSEQAYEKTRIALKEKYRTNETIEAFAKEFHLDYARLIQETYVAGVQQTEIVGRQGLDSLKTLSGEKWVFTNALDVFAKAILEKLGMTRVFGKVLAASPACPVEKTHPDSLNRIPKEGINVFVDHNLVNLHIYHQQHGQTVWFPIDFTKDKPDFVDKVISDFSELSDFYPTEL